VDEGNRYQHGTFRRGLSMREIPMIFSDTIGAIKNTKPGVWPPEPIDPSMPVKWQTRRPISFEEIEAVKKAGGRSWREDNDFLTFICVTRHGGLYYPGDIIRVRETFQIYPAIEFLKPGKDRIIPYIQIPKTKPETYYIEFAADFENRNGRKFRSPLFLPRWASRFTLEIKDVRIERLWDITEQDAKAEGLLPINPLELPQLPTSLITPGGIYGKGMILNRSYRAAFYQLWDKLNKKRGFPWDKNPWVYVIEFMRIKGNRG
jgi:hypothetical protein